MLPLTYEERKTAAGVVTKIQRAEQQPELGWSLWVKEGEDEERIVG